VTGRVGVAVMSALLALYLVLVAQRAVQFVLTGEPIAIALGVALIVLPMLGAWALGRELLFGFRAQQLANRLGAEGGLPVDDLEKRPSGRPVREAADAEFPRYRAAVEQAPEDWRGWYRLALAYDASGDRKRARQAVRTAIALERTASA
jgi:cytochrome c-type biogenesis protein CcmH/NrfG